VTGEELEQAINKTTASLVLRSERPSNRMFAVGNSWLVRGSYDPLDATIARYRAVTADDIRHVVARYGLQPRTQVVVGS
jgi:predicted Zn-dependent peptidase